MSQKLYVANFSFAMTDRDLERLFKEFGTVESAQIAKDRESGRSRGFGFVEMSSEEEAQAAVAGLTGKTIQGRDLIVQEYRPKEEGAEVKPLAPRPPRVLKERKRHAPPLGSRLRRPRPKA
jgi:RNA recognition motif-containing protein